MPLDQAMKNSYVRSTKEKTMRNKAELMLQRSLIKRSVCSRRNKGNGVLLFVRMKSSELNQNANNAILNNEHIIRKYD